MTSIVLISGSLRADSVNSAALATVARLLGRRSEPYRVSTLAIGELPFYDHDVEQADSSAEVRAARELVGAADVVVISTPSYNGQAPGVLKNALDWLSRPYGASALTDTPVAVLSASPGPRGAADAQPALCGVLRRSGAVLVELQEGPVAIGNAERLRTAEGEFADPEVLAALEGLLDATETLLLERAQAEQSSAVPA